MCVKGKDTLVGDWYEMLDLASMVQNKKTGTWELSGNTCGACSEGGGGGGGDDGDGGGGGGDDGDGGGGGGGDSVTPGGKGDPHFTMWNGFKCKCLQSLKLHFPPGSNTLTFKIALEPSDDFHGGCDLVLLDNPSYNNGQGMTIHIRTKIVHWWSFIESVVVKIGEDTLEVMGGAGWEERRYWVNGQAGDAANVHHSGPMPFALGGHPVRFRIPAQEQWQMKIFLENEQMIVLKAMKEFVRIDLQKAKKETFGDSVGLMGSFSDDLMLGRDGASVIDDANEFGMEWQVRAEEPMLFHAAEGPQAPESCAMPSLEATQRRLSASSISRDVAEKACMHVGASDMEDCVSDVMATEDIDIAGAY